MNAAHHSRDHGCGLAPAFRIRAVGGSHGGAHEGCEHTSAAVVLPLEGKGAREKPGQACAIAIFVGHGDRTLAVPIGFVSGANVTSVDEIVKFVATAPASTPNETEAMGSLSD